MGSWSTEQIEFLKNAYKSKTPIRMISYAIGKDRNTIYMKAKRLGLATPKKHWPEDAVLVAASQIDKGRPTNSAVNVLIETFGTTKTDARRIYNYAKKNFLKIPRTK